VKIAGIFGIYIEDSIHNNPRLEHMDEIAQYWLVLKRRWLPATLVFALTTALATAYTLKQTPIYQAKGQVILKKTNKASALVSGAFGGGGGGAPGLGDLEGLTGSNPATTQSEIIKSYTTVKGVLQELLAEKYVSKSPERTRLVKYQARLEDFLTKLKVTNVKGTDILEISFQDPSPRLAQEIVQKVMDVYIRDDQNNQRLEAQAARKYVLSQLPNVEREVKQAENELRLFKEQYNVVDLPTEATKAVETITTLNKEITSASAQLAAQNSRLEGLKGIFGGQEVEATIQSGLVSESPGLQKSLRELQEVESRLALEKTRFSDDDPTILNLQEKRQALVDILQKRFKQSLVGDKQFQGKVVELQANGIQGNLISDFAKAAAERTSLQKQISALVYVVDAYKKRMNAIPKLEQQLNALGRKLELTRTNYKTLLSRLQEIQIAENQTLGNSRVQTTPDLPKEPISPKVPQNIAIGGFLGLFLGAATAFALDGADKRIKTAEEAKQLLPGYPILGQIPVFENASRSMSGMKLGNSGGRMPGQIVVGGTSSGIEGESFRMLQTNLQFLNADNSLSTIVMSSSQPGEGKSTVAANLALATAELGRRVLLVDADMRKPTQHQIWRRSNNEGLSSVLTGQCDRELAIQEIQPNMYLLTAGTVPPNPVVLIDSVQMSDLITEWSDKYDLVIIDAPPITVASDATLLAKQCGGLVFVLRPGVANRESVEYAQELLTQSQPNVLGMILNGVEIDKQKRYSNYYYTGTKVSANANNGSGAGNVSTSLGSKLLPGLGGNRDN
jgi:polysaccharide biosynthesis transport protein